MFFKKNKIFFTALLSVSAVTSTFAGNPDRAGSAGGAQLLINPWAKSSGLANSGTASITGAEAIWQNVAGLAFTKKTELIFNSCNYLGGAGLSYNAIGFSQKVGESGVLGVSVQTLGFGDVEITTNDVPDGGVGTYRLSYSNIGVSYAKAFSNSIYGGITFRLISERSANIGMSGIAFDAGIRYITGKKENVRFGIALRNVGPPISYKGDGLAVQLKQNGSDYTVVQRPDKFELPALLNIGVSYDFLFTDNFTLGANGNYCSNSFTKDQISFGLDLKIKERVSLRGGYMTEAQGKSTFFDGQTNVWTGVAGGFSVYFPLGESGIISLDYSYRPTLQFNGIHSIGARINL